MPPSPTRGEGEVRSTCIISDLILRSAPWRASRRMAAVRALSPSFETLASQAPQDEVGLRLQICKTNTPPRSRGAICPSFAYRSRPLKIRGRREDRVRAAPAVSCASAQEVRTRAYRSSGEHPAFPAQWLYGLCRDLPGEPSSVATVIGRSLLLPTWRQLRAPEPHDFAVRFEPRASGVTPASTASCPASVTIASAPLSEQDGQGYRVIWFSDKQKYFCKGGLTGFWLICPSGSHTAVTPPQNERRPGLRAGTHTPVVSFTGHPPRPASLVAIRPSRWRDDGDCRVTPPPPPHPPPSPPPPPASARSGTSPAYSLACISDLARSSRSTDPWINASSGITRGSASGM